MYFYAKTKTCFETNNFTNSNLLRPLLEPTKNSILPTFSAITTHTHNVKCHTFPQTSHFSNALLIKSLSCSYNHTVTISTHNVEQLLYQLKSTQSLQLFNTSRTLAQSLNIAPRTKFAAAQLSGEATSIHITNGVTHQFGFIHGIPYWLRYAQWLNSTSGCTPSAYPQPTIYIYYIYINAVSIKSKHYRSETKHMASNCDYFPTSRSV